MIYVLITTINKINTCIYSIGNFVYPIHTHTQCHTYTNVQKYDSDGTTKVLRLLDFNSQSSKLNDKCS